MTLFRLTLVLALTAVATLIAGCRADPLTTEETNLTGRAGEDGLPSGTGTGEGHRSGGTGTGLSGSGLMREPAE